MGLNRYEKHGPIGVPEVPAGALPASFTRLTVGEQFEVLLKMTMRQAYTMALWDPAKLLPWQLEAWNAMRKQLWSLAAAQAMENRRSAEREDALRNLVRNLPERFRPAQRETDEAA